MLLFLTRYVYQKTCHFESHEVEQKIVESSKTDTSLCMIHPIGKITGMRLNSPQCFCILQKTSISGYAARKN